MSFALSETHLIGQIVSSGHLAARKAGRSRILSCLGILNKTGVCELKKRSQWTLDGQPVGSAHKEQLFIKCGLTGISSILNLKMCPEQRTNTGVLVCSSGGWGHILRWFSFTGWLLWGHKQTRNWPFLPLPAAGIDFVLSQNFIRRQGDPVGEYLLVKHTNLSARLPETQLLKRKGSHKPEYHCYVSTSLKISCGRREVLGSKLGNLGFGFCSAPN